jgi:hypothetical protein
MVLLQVVLAHGEKLPYERQPLLPRLQVRSCPLWHWACPFAGQLLVHARLQVVALAQLPEAHAA